MSMGPCWEHRPPGAQSQPDSRDGAVRCVVVLGSCQVNVDILQGFKGFWVLIDCSEDLGCTWRKCSVRVVDSTGVGERCLLCASLCSADVLQEVE